MSLPVLSLSSMASREVLAEELDTRELPLHLNRELEAYRRLEGIFTLLQVDFGVERIDGGEVSEEDREAAKQFFLESKTGALILSCEVHVEYENNRWVMRKSDGQRSATIHMNSPVNMVHDPFLIENGYKKYYIATYLESGKLMWRAIRSLVGQNGEQEKLLGMEKGSSMVDPAGWLTQEQEFRQEEAGLVFTFYNRAMRTQRWGDFQVYFFSDEEWKLAQKAKELEDMSQTKDQTDLVI